MNESFSKGDVIVGRYEIVKPVGAGAGGRIFLALDRHLGGRSTGIKVYEPDKLIQDLAEHVRNGTISREVYEGELSNIYNRFRQEAVGISRLDHPTIVKIYDYQDSEYDVVVAGNAGKSSQPFLCMEFIEGETLEEALTHHRIRLRDALEIGAQMADGLAYAHANQILHRDLKPSNLMLEETPSGLRVRIIDWGVAKLIAGEAKAKVTRLVASDSSESDDIRTRGILLGTPKFIAPEHFATGGAQWSPSSDVFSVGMILFRMVTKRPLRRESYIGECLTQADRDLLKSASRGMGDLSDIIMLCLSEVREQRLTAAAVRDSLRTVQARLTETAIVAGPEVPERDEELAGLEEEEGAPTPLGPPPALSSPESDLPPTPAGLPDESLSAPEMNRAEEAPEPLKLEPPAVPLVAVEARETGASVAPGPGMGGVIPMLPFLLASALVGGLLVWAALPSSIERDVPVVQASDEETAPPAVEAEPVQKATGSPDPDRIRLKTEIMASPPAEVFSRVGGEETRLGETPLQVILSHRRESMRLVLRPMAVEDRKVYREASHVLFAEDLLMERRGGVEEVVPVEVKLECADLFDERCNDVSRRFEEAFKQEVGE